MTGRQRFGTAVGGLLAILATTGAGYWYWLGLPKAATTYYGALLDRDDRAEILYKLGAPDTVIGETEATGPRKGWAQVFTVDAKPGDNSALPSGQSFETFNEWGFKPEKGGGDLSVSFRKSTGKVVEVRCYSMDTVPGECRPLMGVNIGDSEDSVLKRLGKPTASDIVGPSKSLVYLNLNAMMILTKQRVYGMAMGHWVKPKG